MQEYGPTIDDVYEKVLEADDRASFIMIRDTSGRKEYTALQKRWISDADGIIFVYSIADRITFERLEHFCYSMCKVARRSNLLFVLVGTKSDKEGDRQVSRDEGAAFANLIGCHSFFEASAKSGENIDLIFSSIIRSLRTCRRTHQLQKEIDAIYSELSKTAYGQTVQAMFHKARSEQSRILRPLLVQAGNEDLKPEEKEELEEKIKDEYILCLREFRGYFAEVKAMGIHVGPHIRDFYGFPEPVRSFLMTRHTC
ncbi:hypothetical protein NP233_g6126 [Leucocoprinus birnbaumii]|uniref:Ras family protein n=1 Tax=Leucocoprinus birnbaumii TaxID=56174 RepID=A0AAD5VRJ6_9AGAR|nr:hypothetical protein NP233_g6126 [Leucocoprinus birnbaumii]